LRLASELRGARVFRSRERRNTKIARTKTQEQPNLRKRTFGGPAISAKTLRRLRPRIEARGRADSQLVTLAKPTDAWQSSVILFFSAAPAAPLLYVLYQTRRAPRNPWGGFFFRARFRISGSAVCSRFLAHVLCAFTPKATNGRGKKSQPARRTKMVNSTRKSPGTPSIRS